MSYKSTITKKGQVTIPKEIRDALNLKKETQIQFKLNKNKGVVEIKELPRLEDVKGIIKSKKNVMKAREKMEKEYRRK